MSKDETYNLRWDSDFKARVQKYAKENGYEDMATLIREAIREKIDQTEEERLQKRLEKLFQNPEFRHSLGLK
jgi:predicted DNA-binding protein